MPSINARYQPADSENALTKRLRYFIKVTCGIDDPRKVTHSFRHRAQDRLRLLGAPDELRHNLLGHENKTVAASYGAGYLVKTLKEYVDQI